MQRVLVVHIALSAALFIACATTFGLSVGNYHIDHDLPPQKVLEYARYYAERLLGFAIVAALLSVIALCVALAAWYNGRAVSVE